MAIQVTLTLTEDNFYQFVEMLEVNHLSLVDQIKILENGIKNKTDQVAKNKLSDYLGNVLVQLALVTEIRSQLPKEYSKIIKPNDSDKRLSPQLLTSH